MQEGKIMSMIQDKNYPQAFESTYLEVGEGHKIYLEQLGDPKGIPIIFLHGGPGSGFQPVSYTHLRAHET